MASEFLIRIRADDQASAAINKVNAAINKAGSPLDLTKGRLSSFGALFRLDKLDRVENSFKSFTATIERTVGQLSGLAPGMAAIGGAASIAGLVALTSRFADYGRTISRTSGLLGESRQSLQAWHIAAKRAGITEEDMDSGLAGMQDAIRGANNGTNGLAARWFNAQGIEIKRDEDGSVANYHEVIEKTLSALSELKSPQGQRAAAAMVGASSLLPMIQRPWKKYLDDAYKSGQIRSDFNVDQGDKLKENLSNLNESISNLALTIGGNLAPRIESLANSITAYINKNHDAVAKGFSAGAEGGSVLLGLKWLPKVLKTPGLGLYLATRSADLNGGEDEWLAERDRREKLGLPIPPADWKTNKDYQESVRNEGKDASTPPGSPTSDTRGMRNNNPGNIEYGAFARSMGATGTDGRFAIFPTMGTGQAAALSLLERYYDNKLDTVSKIINRWAPPSENDSGAYARTVASRVGVDPNEKLSRAQLASVRDAIFNYENGSGSSEPSARRPGSGSASGQDQASANFNIAVYNALPGTRVDVRTPGGQPAPARIHYAMQPAN